ncbi:DUF559 domain-containing protein [Bernardetia sp. OM2101]|uniref:DUF559 domain-containing protein n=1 Tax=Bernardetia sp. OM2101 TaxID=3344876 RepID=UPI0035D0BF7F
MHKNLENNVLVALMNNKKDFLIAQEKGWYRIPVKSAPKNIRDTTIVKYLAFYQTKVFGAEKYTIKWYAEIKNIKRVLRKELFEDEPQNSKSNKEYYKIEFDGDQYHTKVNDVKYDKIRNNEISSLGWNILRFTTYQIESELEQSISLVKDTINKLGGVVYTENPQRTKHFPKDDGGLFG